MEEACDGEIAVNSDIVSRFYDVRGGDVTSAKPWLANGRSPIERER